MQSSVYVQYGQTGTLWDASFSMDQCEAVDVDFETMHMISVEVDPVTGEVSLNAGYAPDSDQNEAEERLFREYLDEIEGSLVRSVKRIEGTDYAAFLARKAAEAAPGPRA